MKSRSRVLALLLCVTMIFTYVTSDAFGLVANIAPEESTVVAKDEGKIIEEDTTLEETDPQPSSEPQTNSEPQTGGTEGDAVNEQEAQEPSSSDEPANAQAPAKAPVKAPAGGSTKAPGDVTVDPSNNYLRLDSANPVLKTPGDFAIGRVGTYEFTMAFKYTPADLPEEYRERATAVFTVPEGFTVTKMPNLVNDAIFTKKTVNGVTTITCKANSGVTTALIGMITISQNAKLQLDKLPETNGIYDFTMQIFVDYGTANQVEVHPNNNASDPVAFIEFRADMTQADWTINNVTDSYEWRPGDISAMSSAGVGQGRAIIGTTNTIASASNDAAHNLGTYFYSSYSPKKGFKVEFTKTAGYLRDGTIFNLVFPEEGNLFLRDKAVLTVTFVTDDGITKSITTNNTSVVGAIINGATLVGNKLYIVAGKDAAGNDISWAELLYKAGTFTVECSPKVYYNRLYQGDWSQTTYVAQDGSTVSYNALNGNPVTVTGDPLKFKFVQGGENISILTPDRDLWTGTSTLVKIAQYKKAGGNYNDSNLLTARLNFKYNEDFKIMDNLMLSYDYGEELTPVELEGLRTDANHGFTYRIFITDAATGNLSRIETLVDEEGFADYTAKTYGAVTETVIDGSQVSTWTLAEADEPNNTLYVSKIEVCKKEYEFNEVGAGKGTNATDTSWFKYRLRAYHHRLSDKTDIPDKFNATVKRTVTSDQIVAQNGQGGPFEKEYTVQTLHLKDNLYVVPNPYTTATMEVNDHEVTGLYRKFAVRKYSDTMLYNVDEKEQYIPFGSDDYDPVVIEMSGDAVTMIDRLERKNMRLIALVGNDGTYYKLEDKNIDPENYLVEGTHRYDPQKETVTTHPSHNDNNSDLFSGQLYKIDELCNALGLRYAKKLIVALDDVNKWTVPNDQTEVYLGVYINKVMPGHMNYDGLIGTNKSADLPAGPHNLKVALYCQYSDYESEVLNGNPANDSNGGTYHGTKVAQTYKCAQFIEGAMPKSIEVVDYDYYINPFSSVNNLIGNVIGVSDGNTLPESERTCNTVAQEGKPTTAKPELIELTRVKIPYPTTTQMQYKDGVIDFAGTDPRLLSLANTISFDKNGWRQKWDFTLEYTLSNGEAKTLTTSAIQQWAHPISDEPRSHFIIPGVDIANNIYLTSLKVILPNDKNWGTNAAKWWDYGSENPAIPNVGLGMYDVRIPSVYPGTTDKVGSLKNEIDQDDTYDKLKVEASLVFKNLYGESRADGNNAYKCEGYSNRIAVQKVDIHKLGIGTGSGSTNTTVNQGEKFQYKMHINWSPTETTKNLLINNDIRVRPTYYLKIDPNFIYVEGENNSFSTAKPETINDTIIDFFPAGVGEGKSGTNAYGILKVSYSDKAFDDLLSAQKGAQNYNQYRWNYNYINFKLRANFNASPVRLSPVQGIWMDTEYDANRDGTTPNESGIIVETSNDNNQLVSNAPVGERFGNDEKAKYAEDGQNAQMLYLDMTNYKVKVNEQAVQGVAPYAIANYPYSESAESVTSRDMVGVDNIFSERVFLSGSESIETKDWEVYIPIMKKGERYKYIDSGKELQTDINDFSVDYMDIDLKNLTDNGLKFKVFFTTDANPADNAYAGAVAANWKLYKTSGTPDPQDVIEPLPGDLSQVTMIKVYVEKIAKRDRVYFDLKYKLHEHKSQIGKEVSQNAFYANFRMGDDTNLYFKEIGQSGKPLSFNLIDMTISGFVWNESDYNSTYNAGVDSKTRNVEMQLFDKEGNSVSQKNNSDFINNRRYYTDAAGNFILYAPHDGDWDVKIVPPAGKGLVNPKVNGNETIDSAFDRDSKIAEVSFEADPVKRIYVKKNVNAGIYSSPVITLSTENAFIHVSEDDIGTVTATVANRVPDTLVSFDLAAGAATDIATIHDKGNETATFDGEKTGKTKGLATISDGYGGTVEKEFDITVYANIIYDSNNGTGTVTDDTKYFPSMIGAVTDAETDKVTVKDGTPLSRTGYTFDGWNTAADGSGTDRAHGDTFQTGVIEEDITLYAQWKPIEYTIKFDRNTKSNNGVDLATTPVGTMADMPMKYDEAKNLTANAFSVTGYDFVGWNTKADGNNGVEYTDQQSVIYLTTTQGDEITLYAQWEPHTYTITFDKNTKDSAGNDLVGTPTGTTEDKSMTYGIADTLTEKGYSITGYTFGGWTFTDAQGNVHTYTDKQSVLNLTDVDEGTVTLVAIWNINSYKVKYQYTNSAPGAPAVPAEATYQYNKEVSVADNPQVVGYTFSGWTAKTPANLPVTGGKFNMPAADVTFEGSWRPNTYTVTFDKNTKDSDGNDLVETPTGTTQDKSMTYDTESTLTPNGYSVPGYTFGGWKYTDPQENEHVYQDEEAVKNLTSEDGETITLVAIWDIQSFNVTYEYSKSAPGQPVVPITATYDYNQEVTVAADPQLTGYIFSGWTVKTPTDLTVTDGKFNMPISDVVIHGGWTPITYNIVFDKNTKDANGDDLVGTPTGTTAGMSMTYDQEDTLTPNGYEIPGYTFGGWKYTDSEGTEHTLFNEAQVKNLTSENGGTVTLAAVWNIQSFSVIYQYGTQAPGAPTEPAAASYEYNKEVTIAANPQLTGYTFSGWDIKEPTTLTAVDGKFNMPNGNVLIKGDWTPNTYTVKFDKGTEDSDGNTLVGEPTGTTPDKGFTYDEEGNLTPNGYEIPGYTFGGWKYTDPEGNEHIFEDKEAVKNLTPEDGGEITLTAIWDIESFNVTYEYTNSAPGQPDVPAAATYDYNQEVTVAANPEVTGYTFSGWDIKEPTTLTAVDGKFNMPNADVTIKGYWTPNTYTVIFDKGTEDSDGNTLVGEPTGTTPGKEYTYDEDGTLPPNGFDIPGYTFGGWSYTDPEGNEHIFEDEDEIKNLTPEDGEEITFTAIWNIESFNVTYEYTNSAPGQPDAPEVATYDYNKEVTIAANPEVTGYTFSGWDIKEPTTLTATDGKFNMPNADVTIKGYWTPNTYTVIFDKGTEDSDGNTLVGEPTGTTPGKEYTYDEEGTLPPNGYKIPGYTFGGWSYTDPEGNEHIFEDEDEIKNLTPEDGEEITFTAIWNIESFNVTYEYTNSAPGQPDAPEVATYDYNKEVTIAANPEVTGYTFSGWDIKEPTTLTATDGKFNMPNADVTIKGYWTPNTYTVIFDKGTEDSDGNTLVGEPTGTTPGKEYTYDEEGTLPPNGYEIPGYTFGGWSYTDPEGNEHIFEDEDEIKNLTPEDGGEITFTAIWDIESFNVTYEYTNSVPGEPDVPAAATYDYNQEVTVAENPELTGYTFSGWDIKEPTTLTATDGKFNMPNADVTIKGYWTPNTYTVIFDKGTEDSDGNPLVGEPTGTTPGKEYTYDEDGTLPPNGYEIPGYTFGGWSYTDPEGNEHIFEDEDEIKNLTPEDGGEITFTAIWDIESFNVTYEYTNSVPGEPDVPAAATYDYNQEVTVAENPELTGYTFSGWTVKTPTDLTVTDGKFNMPEGDVVLEGTWTPITYKVIYDKNSDDAEGETPSSTHVYDVESPLTENGFTNPGYVFVGWSDTEDGEVVVYEDGTVVKNLTTNDGEEITLYAIWVECTPAVADPPVSKQIVGKDKPKEDAVFTFTLTAKSNTAGFDVMPMPAEAKGEQSMTCTILGEGSTEFGNITFTKIGVYEYVIQEQDDGLDGYTYDKSVFLVTYNVTQNGSALEVTRTITKDGKISDDVLFVNDYVETGVDSEDIIIPDPKPEDPKPERPTPEEEPEPPAVVEPDKPNTGDDTMILTWILLALISIVGIAVCLIQRKRESNRNYNR